MKYPESLYLSNPAVYLGERVMSAEEAVAMRLHHRAVRAEVRLRRTPHE